MAFDHKLACDEIEDEASILVPTILYKLPLLILTVLLKQSFLVDSSHQTELLAEDFLCGLSQTNSNSSRNKWEPSLPTIDEEERPLTPPTKRTDETECDRDNNCATENLFSEGETLTVAALWRQVLWSAEFLLSSKQTRAILDGFVACLPIGVVQ